MSVKNSMFFPCFAWAVPMAFAEPINGCHFELGDTLYENEAAYTEAWSKDRPTLGRAIQVLVPARGVAGKASVQKDKTSVADDSSLADSWFQEVEFDLHDLATQKSEKITTTQGRLYTLLWKGDFKILDPKINDPVMPASASKLKKQLPQAADLIQKGHLSSPGSVKFFVPTDSAAGLYREKYLKIKNKLESEFETKSEVFSANKLGLTDEFFPTVEIAFFEMVNTTAEIVEQELQTVLYKPSGLRKTTESRFRLHAHGLLR